MGRASRQKKERRDARENDALRSALRDFDRDSLLSLVGAAFLSPTAVHQLVALNNIRSWALSTSPGKSKQRASPAQLALFVSAAHRSEPRLISPTHQMTKD